VCPSCKAEVGLASSYAWFTELLSFASVALLGVVTHTPTSDGGWLFAILLCVIPFWVLFMIVIPPWLKRGINQPTITFAGAWLGAAATWFLVEFLVFGAAHVLLGASRSENREYLEMLSEPLDRISLNFLLTPEKSFIDVCGVILGNSLFFGAVFFICYHSVRWVFRRSRPTQLSISSTKTTDDED
jgi:hypothetical protein